MIGFFNMDCMDFMKEVPDNHYNLAHCDVQYGIGESGIKADSRNRPGFHKKYKPYHGEDKEPPTMEYFKELIRISKHQIIWGANHFIENIPNANSSCWIIWDKLNGNSDYADCEMAWTSFPGTLRKFTFQWMGMIQGDMKNKQVRIHPNEKPIAMYRWVLKNYAKDGWKILDTHGGSMKHSIACYDMKFDLDICEIDKHYFGLGKKAYDLHVEKGELLWNQKERIA